MPLTSYSRHRGAVQAERQAQQESQAMKINSKKRWVHKDEYRALVKKRNFHVVSGVGGTLLGLVLYFCIGYLMNGPATTMPEAAPAAGTVSFHPNLLEWAVILI